MKWQRGDEAWFTPDSGAKRRCTVEATPPVIQKVLVLLEGDPFPVNVRPDQLSACTESRKSDTTTRPTQASRRKRKDTEKVSKSDKNKEAKQLASEAQGLGIEGFKDMSLKKLRKAVDKAKAKEAEKPAKKTKAPSKTKATSTPPAKKTAPTKTAKKAPAKKAPKSAKTSTGKNKGGGSTPGSRRRPIKPFGENPFRQGTALYHMFPMLLKGGKRRTLASRLAKKVGINPYADNKTITEADYDERIRLGANQLELLGYTIERTGRGLDGTIKAVIPEGKEGKSLTQKQLDAISAKVKAAGQKKPNTTSRPGGKREGNPSAKAKTAAKKAPAKKAAAKKAAPAKKAPAKKAAAKKAPAKKAAAKKKTVPKKG